ncbi:hypothetical protein LCGC14_0956860 [marine sediment metagenome]|uniref:ADP ribosyltransferase domain-containing protein n=1 Tax=marine sediment metagenome TaxID=412755 RepID=A0A0F9QYZ2_9ZZZZ
MTKENHLMTNYSNYIDYDPKKHKGLPLYEVQSAMDDNNTLITTVYVLVGEDYRVLADKQPFFFMVKESDIPQVKERKRHTKHIVIKGGPGSGHFGHAGNPPHRGGSVSSGTAVSVVTGKTAALRQRIASGKVKVGDKLFMDEPYGATQGDVEITKVTVVDKDTYYQATDSSGEWTWLHGEDIKKYSKPSNVKSIVPKTPPKVDGYATYNLSTAHVFDEYYQDWHDNLDDTERRGLQNYTSNTYHEMSDYLRKGEEPWGDTKVQVRALSEALDRSRIPENVMTYRGISEETFEKLMVIGEGGIYTDKGFISTSINKQFGTGWKLAYIEIKVPKGIRGASIAQESNHSIEAELLLQRGTQFRIESINYDPDNIDSSMIVTAIGAPSDDDPSMALKELMMAEEKKQKKRKPKRPLKDRSKRFIWDEGDIEIISKGKKPPKKSK